MRPFPPLGRRVAHRGQTCGYSPEDTEATDCTTDATWHIMWTPDGDAGFACEPHMAQARARFVFVDSHHVGPDCGMPGSRWDHDRKTCRYPDEPPALSATATQATPAGRSR